MINEAPGASPQDGRLRRLLLLPRDVRSKLLIVVLMGLLPLLIFGIGTGLERQRAVQAEAASRVLGQAQLAAGHYSRLLSRYRQELQRMASLDVIRDGEIGTCGRALAEVGLRDATYLDLSILSRDGSVVCDVRNRATPQTTIGLPDFSRKTVQNAGFTIGPFSTPTELGAPSLPLGYPILDGDNRIKGLVFASLNLDTMGATLPGWPEATPGLIVDPSGSPVWRFPSGADGPAPSPFTLRVSDTASLEAIGPDGAPQLAGMAPMSHDSGLNGFFIVVGIPVQGILDASNALLARNLAVLSMAGLLGLIAAWRGGDILIRQQIVHLSKTAQLLSSGNFTARATVNERGGELDDLARSFNLMAEALQLEERLAVEMAEMNKELELAETIQTLLLPQREIKIMGLDIAAVYRPCHQLGGDAYDIVDLGAGMVAFVMADISGHSVSSSLLMTAAHSVTRLLLSDAGSTPASITTRLNTFFHEDLERAGAFFSIFIAFLDRQDLTLTYTNAGHNPPLLWKTRSKRAEWLRPTGPLVGPMEGVAYGEVGLQLEEADALVMYTDGLTEARNQLRKPFGVDRLEQITAIWMPGGAGSVVDELAKEVRQHAAADLQDDVTIVAVRVADRGSGALVAGEN